MVDQQQEPEMAPASNMTREGQEESVEAMSCLSPTAAVVVPNNDVLSKPSPPTLVDRNGGPPPTSPKTSTDSSSLADLKREILSSPRRQQQHGSTSPHRRSSSGPTSPLRVNNNNPSLAASTDYALAAQERAVLLQYRRKTGINDDPPAEESPRRRHHAATADQSFVGDGSTLSPRAKTVAKKEIADASAGHLSSSPITAEEGGAGQGGIEAFVAEPKSGVANTKPDVVYVEASTVIRSDEVDATAARKRRRQLIAYLMLVGLAVSTIIVVVLVALTRQRKLGRPTSAPSMTPSGSPTMAPTALVIGQLATDLRPYVDNFDDLRTKGTPQNSAMLWIALEDEYSLDNKWRVPDERFIQRFVLAVLYFALNGDSWDHCPRTDPLCVTDGATTQPWLTNTNECSWKMLRCDDNGRITAFDNDLTTDWDSDAMVFGVLPPEISRLTALQDISIRDRRVGRDAKTVTGPLLDYISKMASLRILEVKNGNLVGTIPSDFATRHPLLTRVDLRRNALHGNLPEGLGGLKSLEALQLAGNALTGEIPLTLYNLTGLVILDFGNNSLRGTIADEIGQLTNLVEVVLGPSLMTGLLPPALFTLPALATISLQDSQFSGSLREVDFAQIANTISVLRLENNDFSGPIPIEALESADVLEELYVYGNPELTGSFTQTICAKRGAVEGQIKELHVGCNLVCVEGCCHPVVEGGIILECAWPVDTSDLPE
jgi:hypothetical protein